MGHPTESEYSPEYAKAAAEADKRKIPTDSQDKALAELQDVITQVFDRFNPVLTPEYPEPTKETSERAVPNQSPLSDHLDQNNASIYRATRRLRELMERSEI